MKVFDGLNYAGAALSFVAGLGLLALLIGLVTSPWLLLAVLLIYALGQFFILVASVGLTGMRFTPKNVVTLFLLHSLLSWWDFHRPADSPLYPRHHGPGAVHGAAVGAGGRGAGDVPGGGGVGL